MTIGERFWSKVKKTKTGCWLWTAGNRRDYGSFQLNGKAKYAHRIAWELHTGQPIPAGMKVCHHCDTKKCVRPDHLFLGTQADNIRDMIKKSRHVAPIGERNGGGGKLTRNWVQKIRSLYASSNRSQASIAADFGVSQVMISRIVRNEKWVHV